MSRRFLGWQFKAVFGVMVAACAGLLSSACAQTVVGTPQASPVTRTNLMRINRLQRLEDEITRTIKGWFGGNTLDPIVASHRLPPPVRQNLTSKLEDREKSKDWQTMDPSEFIDQQQPDDLRKLFDAREEQKNLTPREQFLQDFLKEDPSTRALFESKPDRKDRKKQEEGFGTRKDESDKQTPYEVRQSEEDLLSVLRASKSENSSRDSSFGGSRPGMLSDIFNFKQPDTEQVTDFDKRENPYLDEYRKLLGVAPKANSEPMAALWKPGNPSPALSQNPSQSPVLPQALQDLTAPKQDILAPQLGSINPMLVPKAPEEPTKNVVNAWNPLYTPAPVEPLRPAPSPPRPNFDAPRRKF